MPAFKAIRDGFHSFASPYTFTRFLTPQTLEKRLCGMNYVDIEQLKQVTTYCSFDKSHAEAQRFWRVLEGFS